MHLQQQEIWLPPSNAQDRTICFGQYEQLSKKILFSDMTSNTTNTQSSLLHLESPACHESKTVTGCPAGLKVMVINLPQSLISLLSLHLQQPMADHSASEYQNKKLSVLDIMNPHHLFMPVILLLATSKKLLQSVCQTYMPKISSAVYSSFINCMHLQQQGIWLYWSLNSR